MKRRKLEVFVCVVGHCVGDRVGLYKRVGRVHEKLRACWSMYIDRRYVKAFRQRQEGGREAPAAREAVHAVALLK